LGSVSVGFNSNHSTWTSEDGNYLYSAREINDSNAANPGDIRVYNVSDPAAPLLVNRISMSDLGIVAVTPHNPVVMGNKLYVSWYQAGTQVFNISQPENPVRIGEYDTWPAQFTEADLEQVRRSNAKFDPNEVICGVNTLDGQLITGYNGNWAVFPFLGEDRVLLGDLATGLYIIDVTTPNLVSDFDGDKKTDISHYRPQTGTWEYIQSSNGRRVSEHWGLPNDIPVSADYDGDGRSDQAIYRPGATQSVWWLKFSSGGFAIHPWGIEGDVPVVGDYDGDGRADIAVWRPSTGVWWILGSSSGVKIVRWGLEGDKPVTGDFDGDGKTDIAVWRPSNGVWYVILSSTSQPMYVSWGIEGDKPVLGDFDGNGRTDFSIYRPSTGVWYIFDPAANPTMRFVRWGVAEDIPLPADYDGDGRADVMVYRPSNNVWYGINSSDGSLSITSFGIEGDKPSPSSVQPR
jgi:hypothetical protein